MGQPAVVQGDAIQGTCPVHQVPAPSGTAPVTGLPFSAPLAQALSTTVRIGGRFVAVQGTSGTNTPPHVGLHASDPAAVASAQVGQVMVGSMTVRINGKPAAYTGCQVTHCVPPVPGQVTGSASTVRVGS